jgi:hypothetical protein
MRLQRLVSDGRPESKERYGDKLFEAWYNTSLCRQKLGIAQASTAKKQAELETAKQVIQTFVQITGDFPNDWWKKFDRLYRQIQADLGQAPSPLERPKEIVVASASSKKSATDDVAEATATDKADAKKEGEQVAAKKGEGGSQMGVILFVLVLVGGGGGVAWMLLNKKPRRSSVLRQSMADDMPLFPMGSEPVVGSSPALEMPEFAMPRKATKKPAAGKPARPKGNPQ